MKARERLAWLLVAPSILVVALVALYPLFQSFRLSFTNARFGSARPEQYVGFDNYVRLFNDDAFISALGHTVTFTVASVAIETVLGIAIALIINSNFTGAAWCARRCSSPGRFRPSSPASSGDSCTTRTTASSTTSSSTGSTSSTAGRLDRQRHDVAAGDHRGRCLEDDAVHGAASAGRLQIIPGDVYEAATVDGANKWQQFWQITLPLLKPALLVALIFRTLDAFRVFDVIFVMKGAALETITLAIYARQTMIDEQWLAAARPPASSSSSASRLLVVVYTRLVRVEET